MRLEAKLAVGRLATTLLAGGKSLFLEDLFRIRDLSLVYVTARDAGAELPVPVVLNDHEAIAARALLRWCAVVHGVPLMRWVCRMPSGSGLFNLPPGLAVGFGQIRKARSPRREFTPRIGSPGLHSIVEIWQATITYTMHSCL